MVYASYMKIGELSKQTNVSVDTVRYYEHRGLIPRTVRSQSGYRKYSADDVKRLKFIIHAKELGFTLEEIGQLLSIRSDGNDCARMKTIAETKAGEIKTRITKLSHMRHVLLDLASQCDQAPDTDPCPILKSLENVQ